MPSPAKPVSPPFDFRRELIALIPFLRGFSHSLCHNHAKAEDLAQEALAKAWKAQASFQVGTNLKAWLFTILRNELYSRARREWRQMEFNENEAEQIPTAGNEQQSHLELCDVADGLRNLPVDQREALILIGAAGFSYTEAAAICGVPEGTVKSRVARARVALNAFMDGATNMTLPTARRLGGSADIMGQLAAIKPKGNPKPKRAVAA